jgi:alkylation response protein AidB-like acyl-CoA dehydrogenase
MAQPNDFGFGEEAALLKASARKFFQDKFSTERLHQLVASDPTPERMPACNWERSLWQQMVELGWTALAVPESAGGIGMPLVAIAGLVEEIGRAAFPCPLLATLNASFILARCEAGEQALAEIAGGSAAGVALCDERGGWDVALTGVVHRDGQLSGTAWYVQEARKLERLLVAARDGDAVGFYWVDAAAAGVEIHPDAIVDLTRDQAHVHFSAVPAQPVGGDAAAALDSAFPAIWTVLAADMVGAAEWQLQTTVDYANARRQFDRPLGFFQAVKHSLVDVMVDIDQARSLLYNAACAVDSEPDRAREFAHMAQAAASDVAGQASGRSVQYHGGIGFTWECFVHLYFKRQKHSQMLFGDGAWHRARLAELLL